MKALLSTFGTAGDLKPFLCLGQALLAHGAEVTFLLNPSQAGAAQKQGFEVVTCGDYVDANEFIQQRPEIASSKGRRIIWEEAYCPQILPMYQSAMKLIDAFKPDVVVSHPLCIGVQWAAIDAGIKRVQIHLSPMTLASAADPAISSYYPLPKIIRSILVRVLRKAAFHPIGRQLNQIAKQLGISDKGRSYFELVQSADMSIALWHDSFRGYAKDDMAHLKICGFPISFADSSGAELSPDAQAFLDKYPAPVVVGLGTSAPNLAEGIYEKIAEACDSLNQACILIGCQDASLQARYPGVLATPFEPFEKLFAQACVVIHHGGIGTCAEALYAGRPAILIPFMADQYDNAYRAKRMGVVDKVLHRPKLTAPRIATAIKQSLASKTLRVQAEQVARSLRQSQDGAQAAAARLKAAG